MLELPYRTLTDLWYIGDRVEKCADYLTGFELILWYIGLGLELLVPDWFYYNQAGIQLEKYENILSLSVKQLVIQSSLISFISPGQTMFGVWKTKC